LFRAIVHVPALSLFSDAERRGGFERSALGVRKSGTRSWRSLSEDREHEHSTFEEVHLMAGSFYGMGVSPTYPVPMTPGWGPYATYGTQATGQIPWQIQQLVQIVPQQLQQIQTLQQQQLIYLQQLLQVVPTQLQQLQQFVQSLSSQSSIQPFGQSLSGPLGFQPIPQPFPGQLSSHVM
jgi:hypothetical protein